ETDDLDRDEAAHQRCEAEKAEIYRTDLRVTELAEPVVEAALADADPCSRLQRNAWIDRAADLDLGEDVLIFGHVDLPYCSVRRPDRNAAPPFPPIRPGRAFRPQPRRAADHDANRA